VVGPSQSPEEILGLGTAGGAPEILQLGQVTARLELPAVRAVSCAGSEVIQAVLVAVRDRNWGTVPATLSRIDRDISPGRPWSGFVARMTTDDVGFVWDGQIAVRPWTKGPL